jgi:hypothetical protein
MPSSFTPYKQEIVGYIRKDFEKNTFSTDNKLCIRKILKKIRKTTMQCISYF